MTSRDSRSGRPAAVARLRWPLPAKPSGRAAKAAPPSPPPPEPPVTPDCLLAQAHAAVGRGDTELALRLAQSAIVADPARPGSYDALGDIYAAAEPAGFCPQLLQRGAGASIPADAHRDRRRSPRWTARRHPRRQGRTRGPRPALHERSGSRFRHPGHPADRAARARGRRLLRDRALQQGRGGAEASKPQRHHPVRRSRQRHRSGHAARAASGVRGRRAGARHLLWRDDDVRAARRQGRRRPHARIRPRRHPHREATRRCSTGLATTTAASRSG